MAIDETKPICPALKQVETT